MGSQSINQRLTDHQQIAQARQLEVAGDFKQAKEIYEELLKKHPQASDLLFASGHASYALKDMRSALKRLDQAVRLDCTKGHYFATRAMVLSSFSRMEEAFASADRALELEPGAPLPLFVKGELLRVEGRHDEAIALLEPVFATGEAQESRLVLTYSHSLHAVGRREEAIELLDELRSRDGLGDTMLSNTHFKLGMVYDKMKRHDEAFEAYSTANRLRHAPYSARREDELLEECKSVWTRAYLDELPKARDRSELPVFILGMPRSGTTLVEQIIASHPLAYGAGERHNILLASMELVEPTQLEPDLRTRLGSLKPAAIDRVSRRELREMKKLDRQARRVTDKLPQNFLHIGLIELLFPGARIIHCTRHPLDTCLSCFFQDFGGPENQSFSYDLGTLGHYYRNYVEIMAHWKSVSSLPIYDVRYEEMVGDQERISRELIDFIGLDWDDACLSFHETKRAVVTLSNDQVRRPMYASSVARYKPYEKQLAPLIEALGDLVEV